MKTSFCLLAFAALACAQDPGRVFEDDFSRESIARKLARTTVARTLAPDRGVHNPAIIEGRDGGLTWPPAITADDANVQMDYPAAIETDNVVKAVYGHKLEEVGLVELKPSEFDIPGCFPALGSRGVKVSFDNFSMREDQAQ